MSKVFVVTDGEYSDYHIVAIFSDEAKAKRCHELAVSQNHIEEYTLDEFKEGENVPEGYFRWQVVMFKDGNCKEAPIKVDVSCSYNKSEPKPYSETDMDIYVFFVLAKDEQHAIKIANEKRVQLIAENRWYKTFVKWLEANPEK